jgi:hypothetical protein
MKLRLLLSTMFFTASFSAATTLSDSLIIENHYTQLGLPVSRGNLEKFLLNQNSSSFLADRSKGCRIAAFAIGGPMWCITTGITIWQVMNFVDAFQNQKEPPIPLINKIALPLMIGGEITGYVQSRLSHRADYLLYKAVVAHNNSIAQRYAIYPPLDHHIQESRPGWYTQDRVLMPPHVLYSVLKENGSSYTPANSWMTCRNISVQSFSIGGLFLSYGIAGFLMELYFKKLNEDPNNPYVGNVNIKQRNTCLGVGIGLISFGFVIAKIADDLKEIAIEKYNDALADSSYQRQLKELSTSGLIKRPQQQPAESIQQQQAPIQQDQPQQPAPAPQQEQQPQQEELSKEPTHDIH